MQLVGANPDATPLGQEPHPGIVNYFIGNDPAQWHTNIPTYGRVEYDEVYPGIDLVYYGNNQQLEYDFVVAPGANPKAIMLNFAGADGLAIDNDGNLVVHTAVGDVVQRKPYLYQEVNGTRVEVAGNFVLSSAHSVSFDVDPYDRSRPLVIDPLVLGYSTFLGGSGSDYGPSVAVDAIGSVYVTGSTQSIDFPTTPGSFDNAQNGSGDAFVAKLTPDGSALAYATYLGGSGADYGMGVAVDGEGNAYVTGGTNSSNFPVTPGAFDTSYNGGSRDVFVTKLNQSGSTLGYSTFLGGSAYEDGWSIAVDGGGNAYVGGSSGIVFVYKLNVSGSALVYSKFLFGSCGQYGTTITIDSSENAYIAGSTCSNDFPTTPGAFDTSHNGHYDVIVAKLNSSGSLVYSTFLGGSFDDDALGIALDSGGNAYVNGITNSSNFPVTPGAFDGTKNGIDAFVAKLNAAGSVLVYSTFLGGTGLDNGASIGVDIAGNAYVTGLTDSRDFPMSPGAFDSTYNGSNGDGFVTKLNASGAALSYSTFLGGFNADYGRGIAVTGGGDTYVIGITQSGNFPATLGAFDTTHNGGSDDAFVTRFRHLPLTAKGNV